MMKGFTVIELLVVLGLTALLLVIAVPLYQGYIASSRTTDALNSIEALELEVAAPAVARQGRVICDNSLVNSDNLASRHLSLSIGSTGPGYPTLNISATAADLAGLRMAKDLLEEMKNGSALVLPGEVVTDSVVAFSLQLGNEEICDVSPAALVQLTQSAQPAAGAAQKAAPQPNISWSFTTTQEVMEFGQSGTGSVVNNGPLKTGDMKALAVEFNTIGGQQVASNDIHGATFVSYASPGDSNEFYVWKPDNLTVRIGGTEYPTGIDTTVDGNSHRYSVLWSAATGTLQVLVDGVVAFTQGNVAAGYAIPGGGILALAQDQDKVNFEDGTGKDHGFNPDDAFHGQVFSAALANVEVDAASLQGAPLGSLLSGQPGLVADVQMNAGGATDRTGNHALTIVGDVSTKTVAVDATIATPNAGATLHLSVNANVPKPSRLTRLQLTGLLPGTRISDGQGRTGSGGVVDLLGWDLGSIKAVLPAGAAQNMKIGIVATATDVNGQSATVAEYKPLVMDPTQPVAN